MDDSLFDKLQSAEQKFAKADSRLSEYASLIPPEIQPFAETQLDKMLRRNARSSDIEAKMEQLASHPIINPQSSGGQIHPQIKFVDPLKASVEARGDGRREMRPLYDVLRDSFGERFGSHVETGIKDAFGHPVVRVRYDGDPGRDRPEMYRDIKMTKAGALLFGEPNTERPSAITSSMNTHQVPQRWTAQQLQNPENSYYVHQGIKPGDIKTNYEKVMTKDAPGDYRTVAENLGAVLRNPWAIFSYDQGGQPRGDGRDGDALYRGPHGGANKFNLFEANPGYESKLGINAVTLPKTKAGGRGMNNDMIVQLANRANAFRNRYPLISDQHPQGYETRFPSMLGFRKAEDSALFDGRQTIRKAMPISGSDDSTLSAKNFKHMGLTWGFGRGDAEQIIDNGMYRPRSTTLGQIGDQGIQDGPVMLTAQFASRFGFGEGDAITPDRDLLLERTRHHFVPGVKPDELNTRPGDIYRRENNLPNTVERGTKLHLGTRDVGDTGLSFGNYEQHKIHDSYWDEERQGTVFVVGSQRNLDMAEPKNYNKKDVLRPVRHEQNSLFRSVAENFEGAIPDSITPAADIGNKAAGNSLMMWMQQAASNPMEVGRATRGEAMLRQLHAAGADEGFEFDRLVGILDHRGRKSGDLRMVDGQIRAFNQRGVDMGLGMEDLFENDKFSVQIKEGLGTMMAHEASYRYMQENRKDVMVRDKAIDHWQIANIAREQGRKKGAKDGDWGELSAAEQEARAREYGKSWAQERFDRLQFIPHDKNDPRHAKFKSGERWNDELDYAPEQDGYWIADYQDKANLWYTVANVYSGSGSGKKKAAPEELTVLAQSGNQAANFLMEQDERGAFKNTARDMLRFIRASQKLVDYPDEFREEFLTERLGKAPVSMLDVNFDEINKRVRAEMDPYNFTGGGEYKYRDGDGNIVNPGFNMSHAKSRATTDIPEDRRKRYAKKLEPEIRQAIMREVSRETGGAPLYYEQSTGEKVFFADAGTASAFMDSADPDKRNKPGYGDALYSQLARTAPLAAVKRHEDAYGDESQMTLEQMRKYQQAHTDLSNVDEMRLMKELFSIQNDSAANKRAREIHAPSLGGAVASIAGLPSDVGVVKNRDALGVINQYNLTDGEHISAIEKLHNEQFTAEVLMYPQANRNVPSMAVRWLTETQIQQRAGMEDVLAPKGGIGLSSEMIALFAKDADGDTAASVPVMGKHSSPQEMILNNRAIAAKAWASRGKEMPDIISKNMKNSPEAFENQGLWDKHKRITALMAIEQGMSGAASQSRMGRDYDAWVRTLGDMTEMVKNGLPMRIFDKLKNSASIFASDVYQLSLDMDQSQSKDTEMLQDLFYDGRIAAGKGNKPTYQFGEDSISLSKYAAYMDKGNFKAYREKQEQEYAQATLQSMIKSHMAHRDPNQLDPNSYDYAEKRQEMIAESRELYLGSDHRAVHTDAQYQTGVVEDHARMLLPMGKADDSKAVAKMAGYLRSQFDTVMEGGDVDISGFFGALGKKGTDRDVHTYVFGAKNQKTEHRALLPMTLNAKVGINTILNTNERRFKDTPYEMKDLLPGRMAKEAKEFGTQLTARAAVKRIFKGGFGGDIDIATHVSNMDPRVYKGYHHQERMLSRNIPPAEQQAATNPNYASEQFSLPGALIDIDRDIKAGRTPYSTDVRGYSEGGDTKKPGEPYRLNVVGENGPEIIMGGDNWVIPYDIYDDLAGATKGWVARQQGVSVSMPGTPNTMPQLEGQKRVVKKDLLGAKEEQQLQRTVDNAPEVSFGKPASQPSRQSPIPPHAKMPPPPPVSIINDGPPPFSDLPDGPPPEAYDTDHDPFLVSMKHDPNDFSKTEKRIKQLKKTNAQENRALELGAYDKDGVVRERDEQSAHRKAQTRIYQQAHEQISNYRDIASRLDRFGFNDLAGVLQGVVGDVGGIDTSNENINYGDLAQTFVALGKDVIEQHDDYEMFQSIEKDVIQGRDMAAMKAKGGAPDRITAGTIGSLRSSMEIVSGMMEQWDMNPEVAQNAAWSEALGKHMGQAQALGHAYSNQRGMFSDRALGTDENIQAILGLTGDKTGTTQEQATYSNFQRRMNDAREIYDSGEGARVQKELERTLPKLDAGTLNSVLGTTTGIGNLTKEVKEIQKIFNETADITKMSADATKTYGQRLKNNVKIYEDLDHVQRNLEQRRRTGIATPEEKQALDRFNDPKVKEFMNTMRSEYDSATQRVAYADTMRARNPMSDVERQDRLRALLSRRGPGGNAAREAGKAELLYEGGLDFMGRRLQGKQIDRLGAGMRVMGAAQSGLFTASMLRYNMGMPLGNAMGAYFQREMARDQGLVSVGGKSYEEFMEGDMGARRRRFAEVQQFMPEVGSQIYGAYKGVFDFAFGDQGAQSIGALASVGAPALGVGMMTRSMTSSDTKGMIAGGAVAALSAGNYILQGMNNTDTIANWDRINRNAGLGQRLLNTALNPLDAASYAFANMFGTGEFEEGSIQAESTRRFERFYSSGRGDINDIRGRTLREIVGPAPTFDYENLDIPRGFSSLNDNQLSAFISNAPGGWDASPDSVRSQVFAQDGSGNYPIASQFAELYSTMDPSDRAEALGYVAPTDREPTTAERMRVEGYRMRGYLDAAQGRGISEDEALQEYIFFEQNQVAPEQQSSYSVALDKARLSGVGNVLPDAQGMASSMFGAAAGSQRMVDMTRYLVGALSSMPEGEMSRYWESLKATSGLVGQQRQSGLILGDSGMASGFDNFALGGQFEFGGDTFSQQVYSGAQSTAARTALNASGFGQMNNNLVANQFMSQQADAILSGDIQTALRNQGRYQEVGSLFQQYKASGADFDTLFNVENNALSLIGRDDYSTISQALSGDKFAASLLSERGMMDYRMIDTNTGHSAIQYGIDRDQHRQIQDFMAETGREDMVGSFDSMSGGLAGMQYQIRNLQRRLMAAQAGAQMTQIDMSMMSTMGGATGLDNQGFAIGGDGLAGLAALFARQGKDFNPGTGMGMWQIQDRMTQISREKQDWQMDRRGDEIDISERNKDLQIRQFLEKWNLGKEKFDYSTAFQRESMQIARGQQLISQQWQREDFAFQQNKADVNFGWQMEDFDRNIRFARGRQRLDLIRQKNRAVVSQSMDQGQRDRSEERFEEQVKWADEKFERDKEHFEKNVEFQQREMDMSKRHFMERMALEDERMDRIKEDYEKEKQWLEEERALEDQKRLLERQTWELQMEIQRNMAGMAAATNEEIANLNESMSAAQEFMSDMATQFGIAVRDGTLFNDILERMSIQLPTLRDSFTNIADLFPQIGGVVSTVGNIFDMVKGVISGVGPQDGATNVEISGTSRNNSSSGEFSRSSSQEISSVSMVSRSSNDATMEKILEVLVQIRDNPAIVNAEIHTTSGKVMVGDVLDAMMSRT